MSEAIAEEAYEFLRAHLMGRIRFDGDRVDIKVAPTPSGHLVASVMVSMLRSVDVVLELPDDGDDSLELQVTLEQIEENGPDGALCDRWCIYHGEAPDVRPGRILDLPWSRLASLRRAVLKDVISATSPVSEHPNVIVNTHATFRWRHGLFSAFDFDQLQML